MVEEVAMYFVGLRSCPGQPGAQCSFFDLKHPFQGRHIHTFSHQGQNQCHFCRGGLQAIKSGSPTHTKLSTTCLAAQILDGVGLAVSTVPDQGVDVFVYDTEIVAVLVLAGIALGGASFLSSARAFYFRPGLERLFRKRIFLFIFVGLAERAIVGRFGFERPLCFQFGSGFGRYTNHYQLPDPENNEQTQDDGEKELV